MPPRSHFQPVVDLSSSEKDLAIKCHQHLYRKITITEEDFFCVKNIFNDIKSFTLFCLAFFFFSMSVSKRSNLGTSPFLIAFLRSLRNLGSSSSVLHITLSRISSMSPSNSTYAAFRSANSSSEPVHQNVEENINTPNFILHKSQKLH